VLFLLIKDSNIKAGIDNIEGIQVKFYCSINFYELYIISNFAGAGFKHHLFAYPKF